MYAEKIKSICQEQNISIQALAEKVGMSFSGLYSTMKKDTLKISTLFKISDVLQVPVNELLFTREINQSIKTNLSFLHHLDFSMIETLGNRYEKFSDQLDYLLDYYIYFIVNSIRSNYRPRYNGENKLQIDYLVTLGQFEAIKEISAELLLNPFSKWRPDRQILIKESKILYWFYFPIFDANYMRITSYIEDGMIKNKEILRYYKEWKKV